MADPEDKPFYEKYSGPLIGGALALVFSFFTQGGALLTPLLLLLGVGIGAAVDGSWKNLFSEEDKTPAPPSTATIAAALKGGTSPTLFKGPEVLCGKYKLIQSGPIKVGEEGEVLLVNAKDPKKVYGKFAGVSMGGDETSELRLKEFFRPDGTLCTNVGWGFQLKKGLLVDPGSSAETRLLDLYAQGVGTPDKVRPLVKDTMQIDIPVIEDGRRVNMRLIGQWDGKDEKFRAIGYQGNDKNYYQFSDWSGSLLALKGDKVDLESENFKEVRKIVADRNRTFKASDLITYQCCPKLTLGSAIGYYTSRNPDPVIMRQFIGTGAFLTDASGKFLGMDPPSGGVPSDFRLTLPLGLDGKLKPQSEAGQERLEQGLLDISDIRRGKDMTAYQPYTITSLTTIERDSDIGQLLAKKFGDFPSGWYVANVKENAMNKSCSFLVCDDDGIGTATGNRATVSGYVITEAGSSKPTGISILPDGEKLTFRISDHESPSEMTKATSIRHFMEKTIKSDTRMDGLIKQAEEKSEREGKKLYNPDLSALMPKLNMPKFVAFDTEAIQRPHTLNMNASNERTA